jgi:MYXO-CTERM domain-containing protein
MMRGRVVYGAALSVVAALSYAPRAAAQSVAVDTTTRFQTIDGFGTCLSGTEAQQTWWQQLYFEDLQASMVRVDITPAFKSPYSDLSYCSPWFGQPAPLSLDNGGNGPDGTRTRRYTGPADYSNAFGGCSAPIAVMGTDIDKNAAMLDFTTAKAVPGLVAQLGAMKAAQLGGFKLYASMWSPAPWVKVSSGNTYGGGASPLPAAGVPWPFIWGGNFAGGKLDVSGTPLSQFDDGTGPTSALTQFARGLAAFLHGFQNAFGVKFYAISIQNELNFEEFYNSATYPLAADYLAALKAARAEMDTHADLKDIRIIGPEDLIGSDAYALWQYGSGGTEVDKNLHYLQAIASDSTAAAAIAGFNIHGYAPDGVTAAGSSPQSWDWWANGWTTSPAAGVPANVKGFTAFDKPSWMTETSGEKPEWLASSTSGGFPDSGAFSIAVKIAQALTTGQESAWLYWQLTDGSASSDSDVQTLTDAKQLANDPKYVAAKHFFRYIRPGAQRVSAAVTGTGAANLLASAFFLDSGASLTMVLVNEGSSDAQVSVAIAKPPAGLASFSTFTSSNGKLWQSGSASLSGGSVSVTVPGYGVTTLYGTGTPPPPAGDGGAADGGATNPDGSVPLPDGSVAGGGDGGGNGATGKSGSSSGCGCRTAGSATTPGPAVVVSMLAAAACVRRRRKRA